METKSKNNAEVAITEQEFKTIKSVMERVGAEGIYRSWDALEPFYAVTHKKYFETQPVAIASLLKGAEAQSEDIQEFIKSLKKVNLVLTYGAEGAEDLNQIASFLYHVHKASEKYEKPN